MIDMNEMIWEERLWDSREGWWCDSPVYKYLMWRERERERDSNRSKGRLRTHLCRSLVFSPARPSRSLKDNFVNKLFFKLLSKSHTTLQQAYLLTISNESKCKPTCAPCPVLFQLRDPPLVLPLVDSNVWKLKLILAHEKSKICKKFSFMSFLVGFHVVSILSQSGRGHPGAIEGNKLFHASFSELNFLPHTWGW